MKIDSSQYSAFRTGDNLRNYLKSKPLLRVFGAGEGAFYEGYIGSVQNMRGMLEFSAFEKSAAQRNKFTLEGAANFTGVYKNIED